jgi:tetratricopeptide (TPR) repeat protein
MPKCTHGNVIITTRNANHATLAADSSHHLEGLSTEDAVTLILVVSRNENTEVNRALARAIVLELGHLPLALAQAAGYMFVHQCLSTYLDLLRQSTGSLLAAIASEMPSDYPSSVAATIQMSLAQLPIRAVNVMRLFAHLDSTSIPHLIISRSAERGFRRVEGTWNLDPSSPTSQQADALTKIFCTNGRWSEVDFNDIINSCLQYSLLRLTTQNGSKFYSMHVLIQSYLRATTTLVQGYQPGALIVRLLGSSITYSDDFKYIAFNRLVLPHVQLIRMENVIEAGDHLGFGDALSSAGNAMLAVSYMETCVEMWRRKLSDEHEHTLSAMVTLAHVYQVVGRYQDALESEEKMLEVRKRTLGPEDPSTLFTAGNLAASYADLGRYQEAAELGEKVLEAQKRVLGVEEADTLMTMGNLALSYKDLGRNQEALELQTQVLESRKVVLGPEDPYTLRTMGRLADSYRRVGRTQEALELNQQAIEMQTKVLGPEHPDTLYSMAIHLIILDTLGVIDEL